MTQPSLHPRSSAAFIMSHARDVQIDDSGIDKTADVIFDALLSGKISPARFTDIDQHPKVATEKSVDWIFLVDTLNFCFWAEDNKTKWEVAYQGKRYTGYFALCAGINRAIEQDQVDITDPRVFGTFTQDDILRIFRSETSISIPLVEQRIQNLKEANHVLLEKYEGSFVNCVKAAGQSATKLLELIVSDFPSYRDEGVLEGCRVSFWKRAQILVGDIWACFEGKGLGYFDDIDSLSMFPDYRVPQVLLHFGAIKYSPELYALLEKNELLENGSIPEMEIRGGSIHAVELINAKVKVLIANARCNGESTLSPDCINSIKIDHFLWDYRRAHAQALDKYPFHKVINYELYGPEKTDAVKVINKHKVPVPEPMFLQNV